MTEELIARLTADLKPVRPTAMRRLLIAVLVPALLVSAGLMLIWLGLRPDISAAFGNMMFWTKLGYTAALALFGLVATLALSRPDGHIRWPWIAALLVLAGMVVAGFTQLILAGPDNMMPLIIGSSALVCPLYVVVLSLPVLAAALAALRRFAPGRPTLAGFAAGIMSGGIGASIYSFHCDENGLMFLALWYTLGIAVVAIIGAVAGRFLLRW
ncbi:hypothetical protein WH87_13160 [Devosia epidermidihirudinis]|uniref:DUF1109 family protein n=1 Tax=Devosia epidermidihirudinis TaxID=1293439 RepID=A0A0F5Q908_9HYPH|nr:DUF1109 domain-containing protein [Devosia epidermidihirudinis]KKC37462.1 hypothetical protein WH87_13160 [Devosia epidermidihirudinis]